MVKLHLSDIVKNYRMQNGLTQDDLAKLAKCSKPYISMIENGKDSKTGRPVNPSITFLHNLAIAMNIKKFVNCIAEHHGYKKSIPYCHRKGYLHFI